MKGYIRWFATLVTFFIAWIAFSTIVPLLLVPDSYTHNRAQ